MTVRYLPSSPIAFQNSSDDPVSVASDPFCNESPNTSTLNYNLKCITLKDPFLAKSKGRYPTPDPSSSFSGVYSSPIKDEPREKSKLPIEVKFDPHSSLRVSIGRKKEVCDILLPKRKHISRQHAFLSYLHDTNQLIIECNGTNGINIHLPIPLNCYLYKSDETNNIYRLIQQFQSKAMDDEPFEKKSQRLTSFALLKGETIIMPFIKDITIDFKQEKIVLTHESHSFKDELNNTDTDEEMIPLMTKNGDFYTGPYTPTRLINPIVNSPCTEDEFEECDIKNIREARLYHTPTVLNELKTPKTPVKVKDIKYRDMNDISPLVRRKRVLTVEENKLQGSVSSSMKTSDEYLINHKGTPGICNRKKRKQPAISDCDKYDPKETKHLEMQHALSNYLAFSSTQQVRLSKLQNVNQSISKLQLSELKDLLYQEKSIGVIKRIGKDASGKLLEEEFYYDLENDYDEKRRRIVLSLKGGRTSLRSCRRIHKQYFWKKPPSSKARK